MKSFLKNIKNLLKKLGSAVKNGFIKFINAWKKYILGPTFNIHNPKTKEKDLNFFVMGVSFVFATIFFLLFRKTHPGTPDVNPIKNDLSFIFTSMFAFKDVTSSVISLSLLIGSIIFVIIGCKVIKKKYYTCISEGASLVLTVFFTLFAIFEAKVFDMSEQRWLLFIGGTSHILRSCCLLSIQFPLKKAWHFQSCSMW